MRNEGRAKPGRNTPCPCGSGRKYKACCGNSATTATPTLSDNSAGRLSPANARIVQLAMAQAARARAAGQPREAISALRQAIALDSQNPTPVIELGNVLLNSGQPREALPCFDHAASLQPRSAQVQFLRGLALEQLGWHAEATAAYQQSVALAPRNAEAYAQLGVVLMMQEKRVEAAEHFRRAANLAPKTSLGRLSEAYSLMAAGLTEKAQAALRRVIALEPGNAPAHAELGKLLAESGKADEASTAFEKATRLNPSAAGHYYELVRIRKLGEADRPLLTRMRQVSQREDLPELHRIMLELAIGKAYDDLEDPANAIQHYFVANALKARLRPLDRSLIKTRVDWAIRTFTPEFFAAHADIGSPDQTPLLIMGMPRSGTTLIESILASHSNVEAGQELMYWGQCGRASAALGGAPDKVVWPDIASQYLAVLRAISDAPRVTDKKPDNFFWAGLIHALFPQARIVHCRRNALDTCVSILANFFAPRPDFSTEPSDLLFYYREYERLMAHWRTVLPTDRFLELDYETLVADPEPTIRRLLTFCDLRWETTCLHPEQSDRKVNTASLWQVRQPIFKGSVGRWRRYEPWLGELAMLLHPPSV